MTVTCEAQVLSGDTADRNFDVFEDVDRKIFSYSHVHISQDVDSFSFGCAFHHIDACEDSIGKETLRNDNGNADADLPSHESTSFPFVFPIANSLLGESHRDTIDIDLALGQSELPPVASIDTHFSMFHLNPQGINTEAKRALFDALLQHLQQPTIAGITETWLTKRTDILTFTGYKRVSRLDRRIGRADRGGIALFVRDDFCDNVVHIGDSPVDERSWHIVHCDHGPVLLCLWYRRPCPNEIASIHRFDEELARYSRDTVGTIIMGDMNVHNAEWLKHSNGNSVEGRELETVCCTHGLTQHVKEPTRGLHLLDLVMSNFSSGIRCKVVPGVRDDDHDGVLTTVNIAIQASKPVRRSVFDYKQADWSRLKTELAQVKWGDELRNLSADDAAAWLTTTILRILDNCVPSKWITDKSFSHPWINNECHDALRVKRAARGTESYTAARDACSATFLQTFQEYVGKTRETLKTMNPSSRGWWKIANTLLTKAGSSENIPALQRTDGSWAMTPEERANELASTFFAKSQLPAESANQYSEPQHETREEQQGFLRLRVRTVKKLLAALDEHSGTGPDRLPARILKSCAAELALPVTLLARKLLAAGRWPSCWRTHWIHGIHKRKSRADAKNYRGVHLTAQLSKVVERAIGSVFIPWAESHGLYGPCQFAYSKGKGYKDALLVNVCNWLLRMERGERVGLFCADVSGAFDRVDQRILGRKLRASGLHPQVVAFLISWLEDRVSQVVMGGARSPEEKLADSVFQGTVLGPVLWNLFYEDARQAANRLKFLESVFADDFICWQGFGFRTTAAEIGLPAADRQEHVLGKMREVQRELHLWGEANRVLFDPSKESYHILHKRFSHGESFKLLGVMFDPALLMHEAARAIATEAGWRLQTLLKVRRFFTMPELFLMYKAQILSYVESGTPALYHAAPSVLNRIDRVQRRFLRELGFSEEAALNDYRLAPLESRRDMAMLGALHKVTLGIAPAQLMDLFPAKPTLPVGTSAHSFDRQRLRHWRAPHDCQLHTEAHFQSSNVLLRSLFGLVFCYNKLPQHVVAAKSVKEFQRHLQYGLMKGANSGMPNWQLLYSSLWKQMPVTRFDALFG